MMYGTMPLVTLPLVTMPLVLHVGVQIPRRRQPQHYVPERTR